MEKTELRIGVYESSNTLCMYLESDASGSTLENNLWVKFRIAVMNQRHPEKSEWKESAICTKTWNNSVLQFSKVSLVLLSRTLSFHRCLSSADSPAYHDPGNSAKGSIAGQLARP